MSNTNYRIHSSAILSISQPDADKLLELGDGLCALLYLHILRHDGTFIARTAAADLNRSEDEIHQAAQKLFSIGLLAQEDAPAPSNEPAVPTAKEIVEKVNTDQNFSALLREIQQVFGRSLSTDELQRLYSIYTNLGLQADTIMLLIHHCCDSLKRRYGENRLPTMRQIEKEAYRWEERQIYTLDQAEEYLQDVERRYSEEAQLLTILQIHDRKLVANEQKYVDTWLSMNMPLDLIAEAYNRTVTSTSKLSWAYMDKILHNWYEKQLFTLDAVKKQDKSTGSKKYIPATTPAIDRSGDDDSELYFKGKH